MKKSLIGLAIFACLVSCENKKQQEAMENAQALAEATREELMQAIAERDQLLELMNDVANATADIKSAENIVSINKGNEEGSTSNAQVSNDLAAIKATLADRRKKLEELEQTLRNSKSSNSKLLATVESLKTQISQQTAEIESLTTQLQSANERIAALDTQVDSLTSHVANVTSKLDSTQMVANQQEELANACYFAIGSKKELKEHNLVEGGGFLRKTNILPADFDRSFFTQADKRVLTSIPLHSNKAKVLTKSQPADSYKIVEENGQKVLKILNPSAFWGTSNYLVIQID